MRRFYLLDVARGLASLAVVVWHYQHFYYVGTDGLVASFERSQQPFYPALSLLYNEGSRAVYLFFVLSGFIFFHVYFDAVRRGKIGPQDFTLLRFSRLYPLHLATLLFVAVLQAVSFKESGHYIVYSCNNVRRFILNLAFASDWLPESVRCTTSFNGPVWTLSNEVFLYGTFFLVAFATSRKWLVPTCMAIVAGAGLVQALDGFHLFGEPLACFYIGALCYFIWEHLDWRTAAALAIMTLIGGATYLYQNGFAGNELVLDAAVFPALVLLLAALQVRGPDWGKALRVVGDITYSTYLLHFPVTLAIILAINTKIIPAIDFSSRLVWILFFTLVIVVSMASYYLFEAPVERRIRSWWKAYRSGSRRSDKLTNPQVTSSDA